MAKLRLATIEDIKPVKLTIELPASVHRDLLPTERCLRARPIMPQSNPRSS